MASPHTETVTGTFNVPVFNRQGQEVGAVAVDAADFGGKISPGLMHEAVMMYEANTRQGTHHTLRRGQVAGSTKKIFRQKGTGNARAGTKRTNKRRGGGTAKGPKPRDYRYELPKQALRAATRMAVLSKIKDNAAIVVDDFGLTAVKTKDMAGILKLIGLRDVAGPVPAPVAEGETPKKPKKKNLTLLIGTDKVDPIVYQSARNLEGVRVLPAADFNAYEVLRPKKLVLTRSALDALRAKKS
ncbi:MAG TPA: 50S ribosomal protein L4 [Gemmataceae bacterium]|jgi:large subunit ribosomal protein L4|nr:50S ribosomal protein L4 [Gemmataceae bacterium]